MGNKRKKTYGYWLAEGDFIAATIGGTTALPAIIQDSQLKTPI